MGGRGNAHFAGRGYRRESLFADGKLFGTEGLNIRIWGSAGKPVTFCFFARIGNGLTVLTFKARGPKGPRKRRGRAKGGIRRFQTISNRGYWSEGGGKSKGGVAWKGKLIPWEFPNGSHLTKREGVNSSGGEFWDASSKGGWGAWIKNSAGFKILPKFLGPFQILAFSTFPQGKFWLGGVPPQLAPENVVGGEKFGHWGAARFGPVGFWQGFWVLGPGFGVGKFWERRQTFRGG